MKCGNVRGGNVVGIVEKVAKRNEAITLQLSVETGSGSVAGVNVSVSVEGENVPRALVTDANGKVKFNVGHGLEYVVTFGSITGYLPVSSVTYRASLSVRTITGVYREDASVNNEHMVVTMYYTSEGAARATTISVQTNSGTTSHAVVNNRCEFDVPLGTNYNIIFPAVDGFSTPPMQSFTATFHARQTKAYYFGAVTGMAWVKSSDGSTIPFNDLSASNLTEIAGLRVSSSLLAQQSASFLVPMAYLFNSNVVIDGETVITALSMSKPWGPHILLEDLPCYTSAGAATTSDSFRNFDGENNTSVYLAEATRRGLTLQGMEWCRQQTITIDGVTKNGFMGAFAQQKALSDNTNNLDTLFFGLFGVHAKGFNSGIWHTSTQYSQTNDVNVIGGSFNYYDGKAGSNQVVPLFAY